jgi:hypothetical protein
MRYCSFINEIFLKETPLIVLKSFTGCPLFRARHVIMLWKLFRTLDCL